MPQAFCRLALVLGATPGRLIFLYEDVTGSPTGALQIRSMVTRYALALGAAVIAAQLAGCSYQAVPGI
jgi:hypothetical protein